MVVVLSRKTIFERKQVPNLIVKEVATLGDSVLPMQDSETGLQVVKTYKNVNVRVEAQQIKYDFSPSSFATTALFIDDKEYDLLHVEDIKDTDYGLVILACVEED